MCKLYKFFFVFASLFILTIFSEEKALLKANLELEEKIIKDYSTFFNLSTIEIEHYKEEFLESIYSASFSTNVGGMKACDMFTFYLTLKLIKPTVVIESGVWKGESTRLIRKTLGNDCIIICLDPYDYIEKNGFMDTNSNTTYYIGNNFQDFSRLNLSIYKSEKILAFFDDHINAAQRLYQCNEKGIKYIFFNDNYPKNCGSHLSIEHIISDNKIDLSSSAALQISREGFLGLIKKYNVFPNIFPGSIKTTEGYFKCNYLLEETDENLQNYSVFFQDRNAYRWNTFIELN